MNLRPCVALRNVAIVELDKRVHSQVFLTRRQVDDEGGRDEVEDVELVGLAKSDHVPKQPLFVAHLPMKLEVVKAQAVPSESVVLEPKRGLRPLEQNSFRVSGLFQTFSLHDHPSHPLMPISLPQKEVSIAFPQLFDRLHFGYHAEDVVSVGFPFYHAF